VHLLLPTFPAFFGSPWDNPELVSLQQQARHCGAPIFLASQPPGPAAMSLRLDTVALCQQPELGPYTPPVGLIEVGLVPKVEAGQLVPDNAGGWQAPGALTLSLTPWASVSYQAFHARFAPALGAGFPVEPEIRILDAWVGMDTGVARLGFGKEQRWIGPGRFGTLSLSDNAVAPWMGSGSIEGTLPGQAAKIGHFRVEAGAGLLNAARGDVNNPGLLLMDLRYLPIPQLELGFTRMAIFGGEGRPSVDIGQLLLPTEPHIYDDPDQLLPDQNELARLDFRLTLPLKKWFDGPVDYIEGWWEYGGEDVIGKEFGVLKLPTLAGIGNLYGGEVGIGPVMATVEYSRLMDDYFRWYVGHRVYHEGFTQEGRVLGHFGGTDSETLTFALSYQQHAFRVRALGGTIRRVGVIEAFNDRLFAMMTEEERRWGELDLGLYLRPVWVELSGKVEKAEGIDYIPGNDQNGYYLGATVLVPFYRRSIASL
jgi:hypothetical protein